MAEQEIVQKAREALIVLRDAAREGKCMDFRERDPLVLSVFAAIDALDARASAPAVQGDGEAVTFVQECPACSAEVVIGRNKTECAARCGWWIERGWVERATPSRPAPQEHVVTDANLGDPQGVYSEGKADYLDSPAPDATLNTQSLRTKLKDAGFDDEEVRTVEILISQSIKPAPDKAEVARRAAETILRMHSEGVTDATWDKEVAAIASIIEAELGKES